MVLTEILDKLGIDYVPAQKSGEYVIRCFNPSHHDSNPSMHINEEKPYPFYCFACGCSGSLMANSKDYFGKSFRELDDSPIDKNTWQEKEQKKIIKEAAEVEYIGTFLPVWKSKKTMDYLKSRKISDAFIRHFGCLFTRKMELHFINNKKEKEVKYWYNRLVIPICNLQKQIVAYEARDITREAKAKVLYPPESYVNRYLFNYENIDPEKPVYIVEGIMGLTSIWNIDRNVISTFGKNLSPEQKSLISKLKEIVVIPDNDFNKGVDNLKDTLLRYDEFYPREYKVAIIEQEGADPNDLNERQLRYILENKVKLAIDIWLDYYEMKKEYTW